MMAMMVVNRGSIDFYALNGMIPFLKQNYGIETVDQVSRIFKVMVRAWTLTNNNNNH